MAATARQIEAAEILTKFGKPCTTADLKHLTTLTLFTRLTIDDLMTILPELTELKQLTLANASLGNPAAIALATILPSLTALRMLVLINNEIGDTGAIALATAFRSMISLDFISLSKNSINDTGAQALINAFSVMDNLKEAYISRNPFDSAKLVVPTWMNFKNGKIIRLRDTPSEPEPLPLPDFHSYYTNHTKVTLLGSGSFGVVYKFTMPDGQVGAVKISSELSDAAHEAHILGELTSTGIFPALYAYGIVGGIAYIFMEYSDGGTLSEYLRRGVRMPKETLKAAIYEKVAALHGHHYIHNDLKPANIYVKRDGSIQLLDAGSVRRAGSLHSSHPAASTPGYCKRWNTPANCTVEESTKYVPGLNAYSLNKIYQNIDAAIVRGGTRKNRQTRRRR